MGSRGVCGVAEANRRVTLLAAVLTAQAILSFGGLLFTLSVGLDMLLFLAPFNWGLGFAITRNGALGLAALFHAAGAFVFAIAAIKVRSGSPGARRWLGYAAAAGFSQLPSGIISGGYAFWVLRQSDFGSNLRDAPVLAGRGLFRLMVLWILVSTATAIVGAVCVALMFGPGFFIGLPGLAIATLPQLALLRFLHKRIQDDGQFVSALPPLPPIPGMLEGSKES